jgi:hypothetical protein
MVRGKHERTKLSVRKTESTRGVERTSVVLPRTFWVKRSLLLAAAAWKMNTGQTITYAPQSQ